MALVGESGSGKSTAISLVERYYDPMGGQVSTDAEDYALSNVLLFISSIYGPAQSLALACHR